MTCGPFYIIFYSEKKIFKLTDEKKDRINVYLRSNK